MNSESSIGSALAAQAVTSAPAELPTNRLAEALAVLMLDLVRSLPLTERRGTLERLANRLNDRGRIDNGTEAAALLGAVGGALMWMED